jgi:chemotaxis phosphatase CheX-like protein
MSSPISRPFADDQAVLLSAVTEVSENSLFAFADRSDARAFGAAVAADPDWLVARIRFSGPIGGRFALTIPRALALRLCAAFAGADTAEAIGDGDLLDFTGELANMICGTWLTRACQHEAFGLTPPSVLPAGPAAVAGGDPLRPDSWTCYLAIDDTPIRLEIDAVAGALATPPAATVPADGR